MLFRFALSSLKSRRKSVLLTFLSLLISISVLLSVEHIRSQAEQSFSRTVSGVDLIVGAPSGQLNLLLYSVFRMGSPTNSISYSSYDMLQNHAQVAWAVPIALGDAHRGYRVLGTSPDYFTHFHYGNKQPLVFSSGGAFAQPLEAVMGADVAKKLGYQVGDDIVISHGVGAVSFKNHDDAPFTITGILAPTGTPVDKTVHVSLQGIEAMHMPAKALRQYLSASSETQLNLKPKQISAVLVGLNNKFATFTLQRQLNNYKGDRLMSILPGVALAQLWQMMASVENILMAISGLVMLSSLFGLSTMLLASMQQREQEIAVLRILGASSLTLLMLIVVEALIITLSACLASLLLTFGLFTLFSDTLANHYGLFISANVLSPTSAVLLAGVVVASLLTSLIPAIDAYRNGLHARL